MLPREDMESHGHVDLGHLSICPFRTMARHACHIISMEPTAAQNFQDKSAGLPRSIKQCSVRRPSLVVPATMLH